MLIEFLFLAILHICPFHSLEMSTLHKVFVYGTLKRGEPNHHWFSRDLGGRHRFLYEARTKERYPLIIATRYNVPFLLFSPGDGKQVQGEVYEVDDKVLANLDVLEEHPDFYVREKQEVVSDKGTETVWIYFIKKFRRELLDREHLESYSNGGGHGMRYVERYLRDDTKDHRREVTGE